MYHLHRDLLSNSYVIYLLHFFLLLDYKYHTHPFFANNLNSQNL